MLAGCAPLSPLPAGEIGFGVLGDAPYTEMEIERLDRLIEDINAQPLAFVVHLGDIGSSSQACSDDWVLARKQQFERIKHRFVLVPGDNEWTDCKEQTQRLRRWREIFCETPAEYCEHQRWEAGGWVFVTLNVPGSNNNVRRPEHKPRMQAVLAFLDQAATLAQQREGLVVLMQANPFIVLPRDGYASLRDKLAALAAARPGKIVLIHGDTHVYRQDEPLPGLKRIEVWGSPIVSWIRAAVFAGGMRVDSVR